MDNSRESGWSVSGIVQAPPDQVWPALLEQMAGLSEANRRAIAQHDDASPLVLMEPGADKARTVVDGRRRIAMQQGEWWYRGTSTVEPRAAGESLVTYRVENVAPGVGWWFAQLVQGPSLARGMRDAHRRRLNGIGRRLDVQFRLLNG